MTEKQEQLFANGINKITEQFGNDDLILAAKSAKTLGAIIQSWAVNGKTRVWKKKTGEILKKYKKSK